MWSVDYSSIYYVYAEQKGKWHIHFISFPFKGLVASSFLTHTHFSTLCADFKYLLNRKSIKIFQKWVPKKFAPLISMESNLEKWYEKIFFPESCHSLELQKHNFEKLTFLNISRLSCSLWNICALCAMDFRKYFLTISVFSTEFTFQIFISNGHRIFIYGQSFIITPGWSSIIKRCKVTLCSKTCHY